MVQYVIANPASGPGSSADSFYTAAIAAVQAAGITVLGYVDTHYTTIPTATVSTNIGLWQSLYGITNIFFDEVSSDVPSLPYYRTTTGYVHATPGAIVMLNHGITPDEGYAFVGDVLLVFENNVSAWPPAAPGWFGGWPRAKFAAIIYDVIGSTAMQTVASQAAGLNIGVVNITDEPDDLFTALPTYMAAEFTALAALTEPGQPLAAGDAPQPQAAVAFTAAAATAAGAAQPPAVVTSASVTASAALATSSAAAQPAAVSTVPIVTTGAGLATAASAAQPPVAVVTGYRRAGCRHLPGAAACRRDRASRQHRGQYRDGAAPCPAGH